MRSRSQKRFREILVIPVAGVRLTGMTIHRLMSVIATEQVRLRPDDESSDTPALAAASVVPLDDRNDAAAEQ